MLFVTVLLMNMLIAMMANTYQNVSKTVISYVRNSDMYQDYLLTFKGILTSGFEVGRRDIPSPVPALSRLIFLCAAVIYRVLF